MAVRGCTWTTKGVPATIPIANASPFCPTLLWQACSAADDSSFLVGPLSVRKSPESSTGETCGRERRRKGLECRARGKEGGVEGKKGLFLDEEAGKRSSRLGQASSSIAQSLYFHLFPFHPSAPPSSPSAFETLNFCTLSSPAASPSA